MTGALLCVFCWAFFILFAHRESEHWKMEIMILKEKSVELSAILAEIAALPHPQTGLPLTRNALSASMNAKGIKASISEFSQQEIRVQLDEGTFPQILAWMTEVQTTFHWRVSELNIEAKKSAENQGLVSGSLILQPN